MTRLGEYEIVGPLGSGGMSTIQLARARDGTLVVLKRQLREADDPYLIDEGNLGLRLTHPGLVQTRELFDVDGRPVLVLTYVPGVSLASLSANGPLPPGVVCDLGAQVAEALDALHNATDARGNPLNIVHRDVTPNNILIGFDGHARLIDFGIARYVNSQAPQTQVGQLRGTLHYLAPEVVSGSIHSRASDLWSLGVSLFEAAVGRVAVERNDIQAVMDAITNQRVLALRPGEVLDPRILHALAQLVNPEARCRPAMAADAAVLLQLRGSEQEDARAETVARVSTLLGQPAQTHLDDARDDAAKTKVLHQAELLFGPSYSGEDSDDDPFFGVPDAPSHNPFAKNPGAPSAASIDPFAAAAPIAPANHRVPTPPPFAIPTAPNVGATGADPFAVGLPPQRSNTSDPFAVPTPPPLDLATIEPAPVPAPPPAPDAFATLDPFDAFDPLSSPAALKNDPFATSPPPQSASWDPFASGSGEPAPTDAPTSPSVAASFGDPNARAPDKQALSASAYPGLQQIDDDDPDRTHALVPNPSGPNPASMPANMPELDLDDETERNPPEAPNPVSMLPGPRPSTTTEPPDPTAVSPRPISAIDDAQLPDAAELPEDSLPSRNEFDIVEKTHAAHPAIVQDLALKSTMVKSDEGQPFDDEIPHVAAPNGAAGVSRPPEDIASEAFDGEPSLPTIVGDNVSSEAAPPAAEDDGGFGGDIKTRVEDEQLPSLMDSRQGPTDKAASLDPFPESGPSTPSKVAPASSTPSMVAPAPSPPPPETAAPSPPPTPVTSTGRMPPPPPVTDPEREAYKPEEASPPEGAFTPDGFAAAAASTASPAVSPMVPPKSAPVAEASGRPNMLLVAAVFAGIALGAFVFGWALAQIG